MAIYGQYHHAWWWYAAAGIISILFGIGAISWPYLTLTVLVILFAVYALISGGLALIGAFRNMGAHHTWWPELVIGLVGIAAGIIALIYPGITATALALVIAFWAVLVGILEIIGGLSRANLLLTIAGVLAVVFGFIILANPVAGALALVFLIGAFAIVRGIILLIEAIREPNEPAPV